MNLIGSVFVAYVIVRTGLLSAGSDVLAGITIKIAAGKTNLTFGNAFLLGIFCNWLVCLAVWMSYASKSMSAKILGIFFPICLFVTSGFEHCIANMYYIPAGILALKNPAFADSAAALGVSPAALENLNLYGFFVTNLIPVTLGNIVGGSVFVATAYYFAYRAKSGKGAA
jgi:formate/nitrite transporter